MLQEGAASLWKPQLAQGEGAQSGEATGWWQQLGFRLRSWPAPEKPGAQPSFPGPAHLQAARAHSPHLHWGDVFAFFGKSASPPHPLVTAMWVYGERNFPKKETRFPTASPTSQSHPQGHGQPGVGVDPQARAPPQLGARNLGPTLVLYPSTSDTHSGITLGPPTLLFLPSHMFTVMCPLPCVHEAGQPNSTNTQ